MRNSLTVAALLLTCVAHALCQPLASSRFPLEPSPQRVNIAADTWLGAADRPAAAPTLHQLFYGAVGFAGGALAGTAIGVLGGDIGMALGYVTGGILGTTAGIHRSGRRHNLGGSVAATLMGAAAGAAIGPVVANVVPYGHKFGDLGQWSMPITAPIFAHLAFNWTRRPAND